jgi:hypothetical protein
MLSVADIPFLGGCFTGILGFVYLDGHEYRLGSYPRRQARRLGSGAAAIRQRAYTLSAELLGGTCGSCKRRSAAGCRGSYGRASAVAYTTDL